MNKSIIAVLAVLVLGSCISDITDTLDKAQNTRGVVWNPTIAVPLVYSRLQLRDLLEEAGEIEFLKIADDGGISLVYSNHAETQTAEESIELENQNYNETFTLSTAELTELNANGTVSVTHNRELTYIAGANETDIIRFKRGDFDLSLSSTLEHDINLSFEVLGSTQNGNPFIPTLNATGPNLPNQASQVFDMDGLELDLMQGGLGHSQLVVAMKMTITKRGTNPIKPVETISYTLDIRNQNFQFMQGFFDTDNFSSAASEIALDFFASSTGGSFTLADPRIKLVFTNSLGFPVDARVLQFDGISASNTTISLNGLPEPLPVPNLSLTEIGQTKSDSFSLNKGNSNLNDFINNRPADIQYELGVSATGGTSTRQWVLDTSKLAIRVDVEVPLEGTARDYVLESVQSFDAGLESTQEIEEVLFRLYTENGFPVDIATQLYFEDSSSNTVLDSLIIGDILILPSADIDGSGKVTNPNPKTTDIVARNQTVTNIQNANQIRLKAYFNTPFGPDGTTQDDVKFYDSYDILLQFGVQAEVLLEIDLEGE